MQQAVQAAVLCVAAALLALVVRRGSPEFALLLTLGATAAVLLSLAGSLKSLMDFLGRLVGESGLSRECSFPCTRRWASPWW